MRTIIAGSRTITDPWALVAALRDCGWVPTLVLSGHARGADDLGERWATKWGVTLELYPANWKGLGKAAGPERNCRMADRAEALIALWDGCSSGTAHMIKVAKERGLRVHVHRVC